MTFGGRMRLSEKLIKYYESIKDQVPENYKEYDFLIGPDLIWIDDEYENSSSRIAIIGKEQFGWDYSFPEFVSNWSVPQAVNAYREFDFGMNYVASPFWQFFHAVRKIAFPDEQEKRRKIIWTNLLKFVSLDTEPIIWKPYADVAFDIQKDIFPSELSIAQPDVCIFVTGPNYDFILERYFPGVFFEPLGLPVRQFARLVHPELPINSFRTYHPNYLNRNRAERWNIVIQILSRELGWKLV